MAKKSKPIPTPPPNAASLGLDGFRASSDELGLSLDELSQAYAALLGSGDDPYTPAPDAADGLGEASHDELVLQGLFAVEQQLKEPVPRASEADESESDAGTADEVRSPTPSLTSAPGGSTGLRSASRSAATVPGPAVATHPWTRAGTDRCEISPRTILEAMLFVGHPANEPLTAKQVASLMRGVLPREIDELVRELNDTYAAEGTPYRIESEGAGYRLTLEREFAGLRDKFLGRVREARLAPTAVDVLAIIAYNQPIGRDEIDRLRNKPSGTILNQLVRRGLLRVDLPDERARRPIYYTTDRFLELFGLQSLDDLPRSQEIERNFS